MFMHDNHLKRKNTLIIPASKKREISMGDISAVQGFNCGSVLLLCALSRGLIIVLFVLLTDWTDQRGRD